MSPAFRGLALGLALSGLAAAGCAPPPTPGPPRLAAQARAAVLRMSPVPPPPPSPGNALADDPRAAEWGRTLFFDAGLSPAGLSCASCHDPDRAFTDGRPRSRGVGEAPRNAPTLLGAAWSPWQFWDGRKDSAWSQALGPIEAAVEMGGNRMAVVRHVASAHRERYEALFGPLPDFSDPARFPPGARPDPEGGSPEASAWGAMAPRDREAVDRVFAHVGKAIEAFERGLAPGGGPLDRYVAALRAGDDTGGGHLEPAAVRGLGLFTGEAGCINCHHGPRLTDDAFHNLGLPPEPGRPPDVGRALGAHQVKADAFRCGSPYSDAAECDELRYLDPSFPDFVGAFRTPTLRNVGRTAPYMHSGQFATLREVLDFYDTLPGLPLLGHRELTLQPLGLEPGQLRDLEAFLLSLDDDEPRRAAEVPR